jgi:transposase-like protein
MEIADYEPQYQSECVSCGETMFMPEWSGYLDRHVVQHMWRCEACGYNFKTFISFSDS